MNTNARVAVAALAVVAIGTVGCVGSQAETPSLSATGRPAPSSASAPLLTKSFTSTLHGISVSYPEGWTAQAATEPWTDSTFPLSFPVPQVDFLYDPTLTSDLFLAIASKPIGSSTSEAWVVKQMASDEGCGTATEPIVVDGAPGLIGADGCNVAAVTSAGRGYWIQLYTGGDAPVTYDPPWFEEVLATVRLHPEEAVDSGPSPSP